MHACVTSSYCLPPSTLVQQCCTEDGQIGDNEKGEFENELGCEGSIGPQMTSHDVGARHGEKEMIATGS